MFYNLLYASITFHQFYALFSEFGPSLYYLILSYHSLSYLIFLIFCLPAGFWCWDDFKYPRGYPHVQQCDLVEIPPKTSRDHLKALCQREAHVMCKCSVPGNHIS